MAVAILLGHDPGDNRKLLQLWEGLYFSQAFKKALIV